MNKNENQRVKITKKMFQDGLITLLKKKSVCEITITELCSVSGLNRSTFYNYYNNIRDILTEIGEEICRQNEEFINSLDNINISTDVLCKELCYIKENIEKYQLLMNNNIYDNFFTYILKYTLNLLKNNDNFKNLYNKNNEVLFQYIVESIIAIIKKWLNNGTAESPEYIADIIIKIASLLIE